jgi:hypothetical protein
MRRPTLEMVMRIMAIDHRISLFSMSSMELIERTIVQIKNVKGWGRISFLYTPIQYMSSAPKGDKKREYEQRRSSRSIQWNKKRFRDNPEWEPLF